MVSLTAEMHQFIARTELGSPLEIYSPPTGPMILGGIAVFGFTAFVGLLLLTGRSVNLSTISVVLSLMLLGCIPGFIIILIAFSNRKKRVVICPFGVAFFLSRGFGSFYWRDVLKTTRQAGSKSSLTYTVYCHDGRQIVFTGLIGMYMLAETIDVQVARARHSAL